TLCVASREVSEAEFHAWSRRHREATPLYEGWFLALYNIFYTAYPVLSVGLLEQDVSAKKSLEFPELYMVGQQDELFNYRVFGVTLLHGVGTSLISFYITLWAFEDHVGTKAVGDYESFSVTVALSALLSIVLDTQYWTVLSFLMVTASLLFFCLFSFLTQSVDAFRIAPAIFRFPGEVPWGSPRPFPSLALVLGPRSLLSLQKIHLKAKRDPEPSVELRSHVPRGSFHRRSSYAFSHQEGYAGLITRGDSLRARATHGTSPGPLPPQGTPAVSSLLCPSVYPEGSFGVPRAVSLVSEHTRSPMALPAQVVVVADCLSSSWLHLGFDPQSWIKQKKTKPKNHNPPSKQTENTKQSEEPEPGGRQQGWVGTAGSCGPDSLTLFAGHGARLCPSPCLGVPQAAPASPRGCQEISRVRKGTKEMKEETEGINDDFPVVVSWNRTMIHAEKSSSTKNSWTKKSTVCPLPLPPDLPSPIIITLLQERVYFFHA
uniref:P-type ATPase C-terminal domain-containing protein n=1 Tax=Cyanistes caeruleus TaxID=156563 RepID=A0A8C0ZK17_CYACU